MLWEFSFSLYMFQCQGHREEYDYYRIFLGLASYELLYLLWCQPLLSCCPLSHTQTHTHTQIQTQTQTYTHRHRHTPTYTPTYTHTDKDTHRHTHIHTPTHTHNHPFTAHASHSDGTFKLLEQFDIHKSFDVRSGQSPLVYLQGPFVYETLLICQQKITCLEARFHLSHAASAVLTAKTRNWKYNGQFPLVCWGSGGVLFCYAETEKLHGSVSNVCSAVVVFCYVETENL